MANITRFSPMRTLERFSPFDELERMLDTFRMRPMAATTMAGFGSDMRLEVSEDDKAYHVRAEMPGCSKDDIKISVEGNQVNIAAEIRKEQAEEGRSMLCSECYYGQLYRSFTLEQPVDDAKADAKYENGVLMLMLPKKSGGGAHKVSVH